MSFFLVSGNNTFDSEVTYMSAPFPSTTHSAPRASVMSFNSSATSTSAAATPTAAVNTAFVGVSRPAVTVGICTTPIAANNAVNKVAGPLRLQMLEESLADVSRVEDAPATFSPTNLSMLSNFSQVRHILLNFLPKSNCSTALIFYFKFSSTQGTFAGYADDAEFAPTPRNNSAVSAAAAVAPIPAQAKPSIISSVRVTANHQPAATTATTNATSLSQRLSRHAPTAATTCTAVGPVTTAATAGDSGKYSELSCIQKVASTTHLSDASGVNYSSARHGEDAWADEYSAFFPPDSTCANTSSSSTGGAAEPAEVASTLNFSATEDGSSLLDDASMLRVNLPDIRDTSASGRWLNSTSFAVSPLPQDMRRHQHQHRALTSDTAYSASSAVSATSGVSDVLNQAMMMSDANFSATGSVASRATSVFSLAVPATRLTRQGSDGSMNMNMNQQSQSFNISAISPADGGTITSIDASGMFRSNSYLSITDSRIQVGSSAHSFASSNVLDRAMLASYDEDFVLDLQRASASESTTGLSPYLHPQRGFSRSISDNMSNIITPKCDSYPMRTMFAPPPPPEVDVRPPMPAAVSATPAGLTGGDVDERDCTASQQFDRTIDAAFASEHDISDLGAPHFDSSTLAAATADAEVRASSRDWYARSSVESLPPPPPPLEAYPTDDAQLQLESVDNSAMFEESDFNMNTNSSAGGMFNSENDSVLQDTAEFDVVPSGSSSSKVSQSNVQNHSGEQSPVDAQSGNTTASSVLAPPTQLSGSVDYGSGGPETLTSNGYYNHLPMPAISSAPAVSNYLEIENRHPVGGSVGVSDGVDPDFDFKQHLLEESSRKFRELRSFTSSPMMMRAGPQLSPPTAATASGAPALSPGRESFQLRSSFPVDLPTIPSFGSMHSMSYVYSTDSADAGAGQRSPSRLGAVVRHGSSGSHGSTLSYAAATAEVAAVDTSHQSNLHDQQEVSQQYLEELGVDEVEEGDDGDDSQEELDEISEVYDDYLPDHLPLSMSMMSGNSRFTSASRMITQSTNQSMTSSNSNMSCSYTSSVEELHQLNPACKTGSWVQENYLSPHQQQQEGRSAREPQHFSPSGNFGMFSGSQEGSGIAQKHRADDSWEGLMHFQQQQQQQQQSFNPMPPVNLFVDCNLF